MSPTSIILVGPMGAGKSTIGRLLAAKLAYDFVDTDQLIEEKTGADIAWIFDVEGEDGFRDRESAVLKELAAREKTVIATGGGVVIREGNRSFLKQHPAVVYLNASLSQLVSRTAKDKKRPLLQVDDPVAKIKGLFAEREPFYLDVATHIIDTNGHSPRSTVQSIIQQLA